MLVLLRTVLESIMDSGDLVSVADLTVIDNQTCETLQWTIFINQIPNNAHSRGKWRGKLGWGLASYPGSLKAGAERRAWYTLSAHASNYAHDSLAL